ncbi:MAG: 6-carboxytetrahydropterin synthase QueD [Pseudomonadota bacterium]
MEIVKSFQFDAAHFMPNAADESPYRRMHGHSFVVEVTLEGAPDAAHGWVMDFGEVTAALASVRDELDHTLLNEIDGLEKPTLEGLGRWIAQRLRAPLPLAKRVVVRRPSIGEACHVRIPEDL